MGNDKAAHNLKNINRIWSDRNLRITSSIIRRSSRLKEKTELTIFLRVLKLTSYVITLNASIMRSCSFADIPREFASLRQSLTIFRTSFWQVGFLVS